MRLARIPMMDMGIITPTIMTMVTITVTRIPTTMVMGNTNTGMRRIIRMAGRVRVF
jgi:hypothetical protein